jgi:hypothetical protein
MASQFDATFAQLPADLAEQRDEARRQNGDAA